MLYLDSAEMLDLGSQRWLPLPSMSCPRAGCNGAFGPDRRFYVIGGGDGHVVGGGDGQRSFGTIEALDVRTGRWDTSFPPMTVPRHYNAASFGAVGPRPHHSLDRPRRCWSCAWALWRPTSRAHAVGLGVWGSPAGPDGALYVSGAYRQSGQLSTAEMFCPRARRWLELPEVTDVFFPDHGELDDPVDRHEYLLRSKLPVCGQQQHRSTRVAAYHHYTRSTVPQFGAVRISTRRSLRTPHRLSPPTL